jgi:cyanophycinase
MSRSLFLFGDQHETFTETSRPFLAAAGGASARIAVFTTGGPAAAPYVDRITAPWLAQGVAVVTLGLEEGGAPPSPPLVSALRECTAIFMCGGDTRAYQGLYVASPLCDVIRARYVAGVPFAGVSAGALLAAEVCAVWGGLVVTGTNEYYVCYRGYYDEAEEDIQLRLAAGLGLIQDCVFEPHFSEHGGFPRLVAVMEQTTSTHGWGLDEPICWAIQDEQFVQVLGRGRLYHLVRLGPRRFTVEVHEPGARLDLGLPPAT